MKISRSLLLIAVIVGVIGLAWFFGNPLLDRRLVFSTGSMSGAYYQFAQRYLPILNDEGVQMEITPGAGSLETLQRLMDGAADAGFVQGGTASEFEQYGLTTLGSTFYELVWVFHRADQTVEHFADLKGKRIGVGADGSGTQPIALLLLSESGVTESDSTFVRSSTDDTAAALKAGSLDAAFFIASPQAAYIQDLINAPNVALMNLSRAPAYSARHPFMTIITVPEGLVDIIHNKPEQDTQTLAVTANLVVRADLHPDMVRLLTLAAEQVHSPKGLLEQSEEFPSTRFLELPMNDIAHRYLDEGMTWYEQTFPLLLAGPIDRLLQIIVPLFVLWTLYQTIAPLYSFLVSFQTTRWYSVFADIERRSESMSMDELDENLNRLYAIRKRLLETKLPSLYMPEVYDARSALNDVISHLEDRRIKLQPFDEDALRAITGQ